ncbi:hypothetical protein PG993_012635 [Apiospora rasikravindrae]|uniref:Uncharacterized protein n=1 Tax=Apiospora rasikravindrae TaxID=990691 RepID=A0ABR1S307_9PEZI
MTSPRESHNPLDPYSYTQKPAVVPHRWRHNGTPPDPRMLEDARQHWRDAEARGEDPYAECRLMARAATRTSVIERVYRWVRKKLGK